MVKVPEHTSIKGTVGFEKKLVWAKNSGERNDRNLRGFQLTEVIVPEFILDKKDYFRPDQLNKLPGILGRIGGQVQNKVSPIVVFTNLIARRGKKSKQDFVRWVLRPKGFHDGSPLLKFAQRSRVKPGNGVLIGCKLLS